MNDNLETDIEATFLTGGDFKGVSERKDPFAEDHIESVVLYVFRSYDKKQFTFSGDINFRNDNTTGKLELKASSFDGLVAKL